MRSVEYVHFDSTDSVLNRLKDFASAGKNLLCVADEQTAGRGTKGRKFFSLKGTGAYFGLLYFPSFDESLYHLVTPAAAVAVAESADELCSVETDIKWVNDVYYSGKKVCGILTESGTNEFGRYLLIGIGINLSLPEGGFPEEIEGIAGVLPGEINRDDMVEKVVEKLLSFLDVLTGRKFVHTYEKKNMLLRKRVSFSSGNIFGEGVVTGFDEDLKIVISSADGKVVLGSGEVKAI